MLFKWLALFFYQTTIPLGFFAKPYLCINGSPHREVGKSVHWCKVLF